MLVLRLDLQAAKVTLSNRDKTIPRSRPKSRALTRPSPDCFLRVFQSCALVPRLAMVNCHILSDVISRLAGKTIDL